MESLQEIWHLTPGPFWGLLGVHLLLTGIFVLGYAAGGIGLLLVLPLTGLVRSAGYLLAGGTPPPMKKTERTPPTPRNAPAVPAGFPAGGKPPPPLSNFFHIPTPFLEP